MDIRLKKVPFDYDGKHFELVCNMNVLADCQEANDGNFKVLFNNKQSLKQTTILLSAMMNDYADSMGWEERYTPKELGRTIKYNDIVAIGQKIFPLILDAVMIEKSTEEGEKTEEKK